MDQPIPHPSWVPGDVQVKQYDEDQQLLRVSVPADARFGAIPEGWTIQLDDVARRGPAVVEAAKVAGVIFKVTVVGQHPVTFGTNIRRVQVHARGSAARLRPLRVGTELVLRPGQYRLEDDVDAALVAAGPSDSRAGHAIDVTGSGKARSAAGSGLLVLGSGYTDDFEVSGFEGVVEFKNDVDGITLQAPAVHVHFGGKATQVTGEAAAVTVKAQLAASTLALGELTAEAALDGCTITVSRRFVSTSTVRDTHISVEPVDDQAVADPVVRVDSNKGGPPRPLEVDLEQDAVPQSPWALGQSQSGAIHGGSIRCSIDRHVALAECTGTVFDLVGPLWVHRTLTLPEPADADDRPGLKAGSLWVGGSLRCEDGDRAQTEVSGSLAVAGDLDNVDVAAPTGNAFVRGSASHGHIDVGGLRLNDGGEDLSVDVRGAALLQAGPTGRVTLRGPSTLSADTSGPVTFSPASTEDELEIQAHLDHLTIDASNRADVQVKPDGALDALSVNGSADVTWHTPAKQGSQQPDSPTLSTLTLGADAVLVATCSHGVAVDELVCDSSGVLVLHGGQQYATRTSSSGRTLHSDPRPWRLELDKQQGLHVISNGYVVLDARAAQTRPSVTLSGPNRFHIHGELGDVDCTAAPPADCLPDHAHQPEVSTCPALSTAPHGAVFGLAGPFRLTDHEGRITGRQGAGASRRWWHYMWARWRNGQPQDTSEEPARLLALDLAEGLGGQLSGVDPTWLPYRDLDDLAHLDTFEPDGPALIGDALAGPRTHGRPRERFDEQAHAERSRRLADVVKSRSVSGSARTAALWSAARIHHRQVRATSPPEWLGRWLHRAVGYSQRPFPALWLWLAIVAGWWLTLTNADHAASCLDADGAHPYSDFGGWQQLLRIVLAPASFFRLPGDLGDPPVLCEPGWQVLLFLSVALPTVYLLIAIRNVLSNPTEQG